MRLTVTTIDPFAEADDDTGEAGKQSAQNYVHIRIQRMYLPLFPPSHRKQHRRGSARRRRPSASKPQYPVSPPPTQTLHSFTHIFTSTSTCQNGRSCAKTQANIFATERNGRKTLTTVQGLPKKFDPAKILKVIKKKFACNGTTVKDAEMGEVIQLQGDQRKDVQEFLCDKKDGLGLDAKTIKVGISIFTLYCASVADLLLGPWLLSRLATPHLASRACRAKQYYHTNAVGSTVIRTRRTTTQYDLPPVTPYGQYRKQGHRSILSETQAAATCHDHALTLGTRYGRHK